MTISKLQTVAAPAATPKSKPRPPKGDADKKARLRAEIDRTSKAIDKIVKTGGRVGLNDPLSVKMANLRKQLKSLSTVKASLTKVKLELAASQG